MDNKVYITSNNMTAVVISHGVSDETKGINERWPIPMLPLADRPFIRHVIEFIIDQGWYESEIVLSHLPEETENTLGDGAKFGSRFTYHLAKDPLTPYDILKLIGIDQKSRPVLLAHADRLPDVDLKHFLSESSCKSPVVFCLNEQNHSLQNQSGSIKWSGWALVSPSFFDEFPTGLTESELESLLLAKANRQGQVVNIPKMLDMRTYRGILESNRMILARGFRDFSPETKEIGGGTWTARNTTIHSSAILSPPVFIGENSYIGPGTRLGPFTVISRNCIIDKSSSVKESLVAPNTYVGENLDLRDAIVDKNWLYNVRIGAEVTITDSFILGGLTGKHAKRRLEGMLSRAIGMVLVLLLSPLLMAMVITLKLFRKGQVCFTKEVVRLPAPPDDFLWKTFRLLSFRPFRREYGEDNVKSHIRELFLNFLPALINVARGELRFVGAPPRSRQEIMELGEEWRTLYLRSKAGIITEAFVRYGSKPTSGELYSAEAVYSLFGGPLHDLKLVAHYLKGVVFGTARNKNNKKS